MTVAEDISADVPFLDYITEFGKHYVDHVEFKTRYNNFMNTHKTILEHNAKKASFFLRHNQFSDWSEEEYTNFLTYRQDDSKKSLEMFTPSKVGADTPIDWREKGAINGVKDQGSCGSCWAFSAQGAFESAWFLTSGKLERFSESLLVDCDTLDGACDGGLMKNAFDWLKSNSNVFEDNYKYVA